MEENVRQELEVLKQMTSVAGEMLVMSGARNPYPAGPLGVIQEGAYADLILVDGNPLEDISVIGGTDKWFCCKCNQYVAATKQIQLFKLPQCLIIHLKRFWHQKSRSSSGTTTKKINKLIHFPLDDLDLSAYCSQLATADSVFIDRPQKANK